MTYAALLALAIVSIAPHVPQRTARSYARMIEQESDFQQIAATWLAAHVWVESRYKPDHRSPTNDYGLGQVHVAARGSATFLGREHLLYNPRVNLRETARIAAMWRGYHVRSCPVYEQWKCFPGHTAEEQDCVRGDQANHNYWSHMKYGYRVKSTASADLVEAVVWLMVLQMRLFEAQDRS